MRQPPIIVIINKKPYTLQGATDTRAISNMPSEDRQQLITLLETIKQQEVPSAYQVTANVNAGTQAATAPSSASTTSLNSGVKLDRLHSGDADALMAQLIMEEEFKQKPLPSKKSIHKWTAIIAVIVFLLILIL